MQKFSLCKDVTGTPTQAAVLLGTYEKNRLYKAKVTGGSAVVKIQVSDDTLDWFDGLQFNLTGGVAEAQAITSIWPYVKAIIISNTGTLNVTAVTEV